MAITSKHGSHHIVFRSNTALALMKNVAIGFDLSRCLNSLEAIEADLEQLATRLTEEQFHAPPSSGGWSAASCIEHLILTGREFIPRWDSALNTAGTKAIKQGASRYSWWQRRMLEFMEPPYRMKTKTAQAFQPRSSRSKQEIVQDFLSMHEEFAQRIERCRQVDVGQIKVQSPFASWMSYPLGFSFDLGAAHERRHLWQARQAARPFLNKTNQE